ncbi:MAG: VOC family protein [Bdellovibrio sp.]
MKINSIIFHTDNLNALRNFYESTLGFSVSSFEQDGKKFPDCSETYVNYDFNGILLCFEYENNRVDLGTVVINVESLVNLKIKLSSLNVSFTGDGIRWLKTQDPDGRSLIFKPSIEDANE